jgi:phosphatidylglycerol:prolipoprotein diacylglycerol transferase
MLSWYQHLPEHIDPIIFSIGSFSLRWYAIMYLAGFSLGYALLRWRISRDGNSLKFPISSSRFLARKARASGQDSDKIPAQKMRDYAFDWIIYAALGVLIGGRLGYVFFYQPAYYLQNPLEIFSPYDFSSQSFSGIFGMSYFGGLIGVLAASFIFTVRRGIRFLDWADFVIPVVPASYFFGRIGNFLNGELYGRGTQLKWGMYFPADQLGLLRHPSQVYEAIFEGAVLFLIFWSIRNQPKYKGKLLFLYLIGYATVRFGVEFLRNPDFSDNLIWGWMTKGQAFSLFLLAGSLFLWAISRLVLRPGGVLDREKAN